MTTRRPFVSVFARMALAAFWVFGSGTGSAEVDRSPARSGRGVSARPARHSIVTAPDSSGPGSTLFLPMWEVSANGTTGGDIPAGGTDTVVSWANRSSGNVVTHVTLWNRRGKPVIDFNIPLRGGDAVQMSLRGVLNGLLNVNPAVQKFDPRGDVCKQPEWLRFSNPDPSDQFSAICFYATPAYSGSFRRNVWDSLDESVDDPACGQASDGVFQGPFRGSLTIDVVNYATNFFASDPSFFANDAIATVWPDGTVNVLQGSSLRLQNLVPAGGYPLEVLRFDPALSWTSPGSTFYSAFVTALDTGLPVVGVPAGYAFQGDGRTPAFGQQGTFRLSSNPAGGSASLPTTVTFEALVNPLGGACASFSCQLELVSGPTGGSASASYGVATAGALDGIARWVVQVPAGVTATEFWVIPYNCPACSTCTSNRVPWTLLGGLGSTLFLPMWEVSANGTTGGDIPAGGTDTVVSWTNRSNGNVVTHVTLWNRRGKPVIDFNIPLRGGDAVQMSLRGVLNGLLNVNPAVQKFDPRGDVCKQPEWLRFSNPDAADQFSAICFYATPAYSGSFRRNVWDSLDESVDNPACGQASDGVFQGPFRGSLTIDVVNYATNFFASDASFWTNDAIATVWPSGTVNVLQGSSVRSENLVPAGGYPLEVLRFDPALSWTSPGSTFYSAFVTALDTGLPVVGVPAGYAFQGDGRAPAYGQQGTLRLSADPADGAAASPTTATFEALVNPLGGACAGFSCQLELVSGTLGGSASASYGVATAGVLDGIARWIVPVPAGATATEFWVIPSSCTACSTCTSNRFPWTAPTESSLQLLTPCRVFDTRLTSEPSAAAPALAPWETRTFAVETRCGLPWASVRSLSVNQTVTGSTGDGELVLYRGDLAHTPMTSGISFREGETRANNGILELSRSGDGTIKVHNRSAGSVHFILDVNGFFQ